MTSAVTLGLPSRSPPIHDPKVMGVAEMGRSLPVSFLRAWENLRRTLGSAVHCGGVGVRGVCQGGRGGRGGKGVA